ncbi:unnamed protein product, partial [Choristocarpus tenellus]
MPLSVSQLTPREMHWRQWGTTSVHCGGQDVLKGITGMGKGWAEPGEGWSRRSTKGRREYGRLKVGQNVKINDNKNVYFPEERNVRLERMCDSPNGRTNQDQYGRHRHQGYKHNEKSLCQWGVREELETSRMGVVSRPLIHDILEVLPSTARYETTSRNIENDAQLRHTTEGVLEETRRIKQELESAHRNNQYLQKRNTDLSRKFILLRNHLEVLVSEEHKIPFVQANGER